MSMAGADVNARARPKGAFGLGDMADALTLRLESLQQSDAVMVFFSFEHQSDDM
jgi:hypothetical protein